MKFNTMEPNVWVYESTASNRYVWLASPFTSRIQKNWQVLPNPKSRKEKKVATKVLEALGGFKFGCDPEGFIKNTQTGEYVTAEGLIPGTKLEPHPVKHGAVQVDGMAAEFNIDPASELHDFNRNIAAVINQFEKMLPEHHVLEFVPAVHSGKRSSTMPPTRPRNSVARRTSTRGRGRLTLRQRTQTIRSSARLVGISISDGPKAKTSPIRSTF
jgi:hypothetical protein